MSESGSNSSEFRIDRRATKMSGPHDSLPPDMDPSYGVATAILGRPWQSPPPNIEANAPAFDREGRELARRMTLLRERAGAAGSAVSDAVEAFFQALHDSAPRFPPGPPDPAMPARLRGLYAAVLQQTTDAAIRQALDDLCAFPSLAARM